MYLFTSILASNRYDDVIKRTRRAQMTAVVDLLVYVDYSAYQLALKRHKNDKKMALKYLRHYYTSLVELVGE